MSGFMATNWQTIFAIGFAMLVGCADQSEKAPINASPGGAVTATADRVGLSDSSEARSEVSDSGPTIPNVASPAAPVTASLVSGGSTGTTSALEEYSLGDIIDAIDGKPGSRLSRDQIADGWIALFDGHSLFGWKANSDANWSVKDGAITADSGKPGLLLTTVRFADFELKCDYRLAKGGNSGIFLRTVFEPKDPAKDCYELNMCDTHPAFGTGSLVARVKPPAPIVGEDGEWHSFTVRCVDTTVSVQFDGKPVLVYDIDNDTEKARREGRIGLQMNGGKVEFRNVFLKPLSTKPLFNGTDLTGWRVVPGSKSTFDVKDGAIHVENGTGFLETEATFANFVLQGQARTNGDRLNSGVFFRAMPGTEKAPSNGYEYQIHNGYNDGDRTKPIDHGTGAIFRREKARYVVPNDREWFTFTLVADGPSFASWVDGYPVVAWTDEREPDENPRKGKRLEAGHFSLQGHDATTNLDFRALKAVEIPKP